MTGSSGVLMSMKLLPREHKTQSWERRGDKDWFGAEIADGVSRSRLRALDDVLCAVRVGPAPDVLSALGRNVRWLMRALLWCLSGFDHTRSHVEVGLLLVLVRDEGNHVDVVARVRTSHPIDALIGPTEPVEKGSASAQMLVSTMARVQRTLGRSSCATRCTSSRPPTWTS